MDKKKLFTLSLKFKRHNLQFDFDEASQTITIGKTQKVKRKILQGVLIVLISLPVILSVGLLDIPGRRYLLFVLLLPSIYGISQIIKYVNLANKNKYKKTIGKDSIQIESAEGMKTYDKSQIAKIDIDLKRDEEMEGEGSILIETVTGEKVDLLHLRSKKVSDLKIDFEYLKEFIEESMELKVTT